MDSNNEYEIALIENEIDARLCAELLAEEFALHNPLSIFNQSTAQSLFNTWLSPLITDALDEKLSFLVRCRLTNEIVAAIIGMDLFQYCEKHPYDASSSASSNPTADLYDELRDRFVHHDFEQKLKPNMVLYIAVGATRTQHSNKGIAARLRAHLCNYARDTKGFQYAFIQTSSPATRHIYINKMNGKELTIIDPATWVWKKKGDGLSYPFKDYKGEPAVNIIVELQKQ
ncbi:unnamed protein product [Adineta steineri]|uniref:N-acetyltransferase domain-containing protein n=1 Tax=Adineta steineri TaxID=433720 RepID=A0A814EWF7_9BILA|nr:unnamed protein product [Adineta steineri]CAF1081012.1 unnamed protein product [Adineta steineri]CAF1121338.1 unnamed protein product [Adineta steineri]CAF3799146.1 unnamed protein product [Adineta steineri]CAF4087450.1 unnamed protein product [Adineta steineri]